MAEIICPPPTPPAATGSDEGPPPPRIVPRFPPRYNLVGKKRIVVEQNDYQVLPAEYYEQGITPYQHLSDERFLYKPWEDFSEISDRFRSYCGSYWTRTVKTSELQFDVFGEEVEVRDYNFEYASGELFTGRPQGPWQVLGLDVTPYMRNYYNEQTDSPFSISGLTDPPINDGTGLRAGDFLNRFWNYQKITLKAKDKFFSNITPPQFLPIYWEEFIRGTEAVATPGGIRLRQQEEYPFVTIDPLIRGNTWYSDFSFDMTLPLLPHELSAVSATDVSLSVARCDPEYNFFIQGYESILKEFFTESVSLIPFEFFLPNMYIFIAEKLTERSVDRDFINFLTLGGKIINTDVIRVPRRHGHPTERSTGVYFDDWARGFREIVADLRGPDLLEALDRTLGQAKKYNKVIYAGNGDFKLLQSSNWKKNLFPMYVDIEFSTDRVGRDSTRPSAADMLGANQLVNVLMKDTFRTDFQNTIIGTENFVYSTDLAEGEGGAFTDIKINQPTKIFDLSRWINTYLNSATPEWFEQDVLAQSTSPYMDIYAPDPEPPLEIWSERRRQVISFANELARISEGKFRSFPEIMMGKLAESETLFYKIAKYQFVNGSIYTTPLQEIFLPNSSEVDILKYVDTQIANEKNYKYVVYAYELVWGSYYKYIPPAPDIEPEDLGLLRADLSEGGQFDNIEGVVSGGEGVGEDWVLRNSDERNPGDDSPAVDPNAPPISLVVVDDASATFSVQVRPHLKILEIPFFELWALVADKPPLPPDVEIIPYRAVNNRLLFLFSSMTGEMKAHPVIMSAGDEEKFDNIRRAQGLWADDRTFEAGDPIFDYSKKLDWKGDDPASAYEIFRTTTPPASYGDFFGTPYQRVSAEESSGCGRVASIAFFEDELQPNIKYYYTFREIDIHEKPSNPTRVFEIELVDDNGLIFPRIKTYDFPKIKLDKESETFKRYLLIAPGLGQDELVITNDELPQSAADATVQLGNVSSRIFSQPWPNDGPIEDPNRIKFKIRITSKQTGKKVDINVRFRHLHDKELKCS